MINSIPLGKFAEPEDISDAVLFLLSDRAVRRHDRLMRWLSAQHPARSRAPQRPDRSRR